MFGLEFNTDLEVMTIARPDGPDGRAWHAVEPSRFARWSGYPALPGARKDFRVTFKLGEIRCQRITRARSRRKAIRQVAALEPTCCVVGAEEVPA